MVPKAAADDFIGRFREIVADPLNLLIERVPEAGTVDGDLVCLHNGHKVALSGPNAYYEGFALILVINRGVHEPLEEYVFQQLMKIVPRAPTMLELGAYWGHYSMWLKKVRPEARVVLVEPHDTSFAAGIANFKLNGYEGEFIQAMVGDGNFAVDTWMESEKLEKLDILHCDIQGFEVQMLGGFRRALERGAVDYMFISTHSQPLHAEVVRVLGLFGYRVEVSSDFEFETTSYDGFIFASHARLPRVVPIDPNFTRVGIVQSSASELLDRLVKVREAIAPQS